MPRDEWYRRHLRRLPACVAQPASAVMRMLKRRRGGPPSCCMPARRQGESRQEREQSRQRAGWRRASHGFLLAAHRLTRLSAQCLATGLDSRNPPSQSLPRCAHRLAGWSHRVATCTHIHYVHIYVYMCICAGPSPRQMEPSRCHRTRGTGHRLATEGVGWVRGASTDACASHRRLGPRDRVQDEAPTTQPTR